MTTTSTALALLTRVVLAALATAAVLLSLHAAPVVDMARMPAPALPTVAHCWAEPSGELLSGDPALAVPGSVTVPCP